MSYPTELVRSRGKDTLLSGVSQRRRRENAIGKGELKASPDEAKELSQ
jgi:hypothetical protein